MTKYGDVSVPLITVSVLFSSAPLGGEPTNHCPPHWPWTNFSSGQCWGVSHVSPPPIGIIVLLPSEEELWLANFDILSVAIILIGLFFFCLQPISLLDMRKWSPVCVKPSPWLSVLVFWRSFSHLVVVLLLNVGNDVGFFDGLALWMAYTIVSCWTSRENILLSHRQVVRSRGGTDRSVRPPLGVAVQHLFFYAGKNHKERNIDVKGQGWHRYFDELTCFFFFLTLPLGKWVFPPPGLGGHWGPLGAPRGHSASFTRSPGSKLSLTPSHIFHFRCGII